MRVFETVITIWIVLETMSSTTMGEISSKGLSSAGVERDGGERCLQVSEGYNMEREQAHSLSSLWEQL